MAHRYRSDGPGGLAHVALATGILLGLGLYTHAPEWVAALFFPQAAKAEPQRVVTVGARDDACARRSLETAVGMLGCQGARDADHRRRTTLVPQN